MVRDQAFSDEALPFGLFKEPPSRRQYGQGSGVIVSPDGYIITNNHVVADAVDVEVILAIAANTKARLSRGSKTDVAVVKIHASNLPTATGGFEPSGRRRLRARHREPAGLEPHRHLRIVSAVGRADVGVATSKTLSRQTRRSTLEIQAERS